MEKTSEVERLLGGASGGGRIVSAPAKPPGYVTRLHSLTKAQRKAIRRWPKENKGPAQTPRHAPIKTLRKGAALQRRVDAGKARAKTTYQAIPAGLVFGMPKPEMARDRREAKAKRLQAIEAARAAAQEPAHAE